MFQTKLKSTVERERDRGVRERKEIILPNSTAQ